MLKHLYISIWKARLYYILPGLSFVLKVGASYSLTSSSQSSLQLLDAFKLRQFHHLSWHLWMKVVLPIPTAPGGGDFKTIIFLDFLNAPKVGRETIPESWGKQSLKAGEHHSPIDTSPLGWMTNTYHQGSGFEAIYPPWKVSRIMWKLVGKGRLYTLLFWEWRPIFRGFGC